MWVSVAGSFAQPLALQRQSSVCSSPMASLGSDAAPNAVTTTLDPVPPPSLQDRIQTLTDVHNRLQTLRHVPPMLLRPPSASPLADFPPPFDPTIDREFAVTFSSTPTHDFRALKDFLGVLCCDKVQGALRAARASEDADQSELGLSFRRENRKRKYVCTSGWARHEIVYPHRRPQSPVGSPQPYVPSPPRSSSIFAPPEDDPPPMRAEALVEFVREFNRGNVGELKSSAAAETDTALPKCTLAIWSRTKTIQDEPMAEPSNNGARKPHAGRLTSPVVLRFMISDVLTTYISLIFTNLEDPLVVESVTAFGPRERVCIYICYAHYIADDHAAARCVE